MWNMSDKRTIQCFTCKERKEHGQYSDGGIDNGSMLWLNKEYRHTCNDCQAILDKRHEDWLVWIASEEGQAEIIKERLEREAVEKKDFEENYYLYEGKCCECFAPVNRYVRKGKIISGNGFRCGCVDRVMTEERMRV